MMLGMPDTAETDGVRRPGRPRDARAEAAILDAALDLVREHGFGGVTIDAVAARAGVGRATIYRRWSTREELLFEAASKLGGPATPELVGDLRTDLAASFRHLADHLRDDLTGCVVPELASEAARSEPMCDLLHALVAQGRAAPLAVVRAAIDRGELRAEVDPVLVVDALSGALFFRQMMSGDRIDHEVVEQLVDVVLDGVRVRA